MMPLLVCLILRIILGLILGSKDQCIMLACEFRRNEIVRDLAIHLGRRFRDHEYTFPR